MSKKETNLLAATLFVVFFGVSGILIYAGAQHNERPYCRFWTEEKHFIGKVHMTRRVCVDEELLELLNKH